MPILTLRERRDDLDIRMSLFCSPTPLDQQFLTEGLCYSYSIHLRYAAMFRNLDIELILKGILKKRKLVG